MRVNIAYSSSDLYAQCTGISILSLLHNNREIEELQIYIIDSDISKKNKTNIIRLAESYGRKIEFISAQKQFENKANEMNFSLLRGAYNTYARLMLNQWFSNIDKILIIDSDTLVTGSILELWQTDLQNNLMAAVPEIGVYAEGTQSEDLDIIDMHDNFYNVGIAMFNLKQWRKENIDNLIKGKIKQYGKEFMAAEQSIINYSIGNRILKLNLKYNYYTHVHAVSYKTVSKVFSRKTIFSISEFEGAQERPVIIHFVGFPFERPWYARSATPYNNLYQKYRNQSPWSDTPLAQLPPAKNVLFGVYDYVVRAMKRMNMYSFTLWFRFILGQRIKKLTGQNR